MNKPGNKLPLPYDCILLAAGESKRMGSEHKLLLPFKGKPLFLHALSTALAACRRVVLVEGAVKLSSILKEYGLANQVKLATNNRYAEGQLGSLQCGLKAAQTDWVFVMLGDLPFVPASVFALLYEHAEGRESVMPKELHRTAGAVLPVYSNNSPSGHPVLLGPSAIKLVHAAKPDDRIKHVIEPSGPRYVDCSNSNITNDVDTPEAYKRLQG